MGAAEMSAASKKLDGPMRMATGKSLREYASTSSHWASLADR
jgi:hypothetical protein